MVQVQAQLLDVYQLFAPELVDSIEKRAADVWNLLAAVKTEWSKYGEILDKVHKKLHEASETIEKAQTRTRAIGRKLRDVQGLPASDAGAALALESHDGDTMEDENMP